MSVKLTEGERTVTGGTAIEVTANKVINLLLRSENNLIGIDENEIYVDLQLPDGLTPEDVLPVGVTTGRIVQNDGWSVTGTMLVSKTTSGDYLLVVYGDDGKLYVDNGTGTFKQVYLKSEVDALFTQLRSEISAVGYSGEYSDLLNKPTLGTAAALNTGNNPGEIPVVQQNGMLADSIIPKKISSTYVVQNVSDLTGISQAVAGDLAVVVTESKTFILQQDPYSVASNWVELLSPGSSVTSVNGQTGAVTLTTANVPASGSYQYINSTERANWNAKLGTNDVATVAITGSYTDLSNKPTIPAAQIQSDWNQNNQSAVDYIKNKPTIDATLDTTSQHAIQNGAVATAINDINGDISDIQGDISDITTEIGDITGDVSGKQDTLVSGENIKTINGDSILGSGNLVVNPLPQGGTTGQVLAMTENGPAWVDVNTLNVIVPANNSPIGVKEIWAGEQQDYEDLSEYDDNTIYTTI